MVCPFRHKINNEFVEAPNGGLHIKTQIQSYPECLYDECPFYESYNNECRSVEAQFEQ